MLSCLCSLSHFILTPRCLCVCVEVNAYVCVFVCVCVCVLDRLLCPLRPHPCGCAVLCSGNNDGFCASQSPSQQDTHIKGSFSGQPCTRLCVCVCVRVVLSLVCVCVAVCVFVRLVHARLRVILRTSFSAVHADCASYCARVQPIKVHIGTLALSVSSSISLALTPLPFSIYLSAPLFLLNI